MLHRSVMITTKGYIAIQEGSLGYRASVTVKGHTAFKNVGYSKYANVNQRLHFVQEFHLVTGGFCHRCPTVRGYSTFLTVDLVKGGFCHCQRLLFYIPDS